MADVDNRPECQLPDGPLTWGVLAKLGDCRIPIPEEGITIQVPSEIRDRHGHVLDGDHDPKGHDGCDHRDTPEWKAEHPRPKKEKTMAETTQKPADHAEHAAAEQPAPQTTETVGVDAAVSQVKSLVPADASPALLIGGAAVLAVIGGALKFGPSVLKARAEARERDHELQMKKLELEEKKSEDRSEDEHSKCSAARGALELRVAGVEKRLDEVASAAKKAVSSLPQFDEDFNPEAIEKRLAKLEKAAKKTAPKKR